MNRKLKIQIAEQVRQIKATLRYSAVRPASGITYTLLVLINDSIDKTEKSWCHSVLKNMFTIFLRQNWKI